MRGARGPTLDGGVDGGGEGQGALAGAAEDVGRGAEGDELVVVVRLQALPVKGGGAGREI